MVPIILVPLSFRVSIIAVARAAPSVGSVPAPNSSNKTKESLSASLIIPTILVKWDENVDKLCSILCSSPISANTSL